ncbi:uncharacterized protein ACBR49_004930 isoform 2-T2 [Aulostomus maculatus]
MSVVFNSKLGAIRGDGWSLMDTEDRSKYGQRSKCSGCIVAAAVCLGLLYLLLLAVILGIVAQNTKAVNPKEIDQMHVVESRCENLTSQWIQLQMNYNTIVESRNQLQTLASSLTEQRDILRYERDWLRVEANNMTNTMERLQARLNVMTASRDELQVEVDRMNLNRTERSCKANWINFNNKCYYVSEKGQTKSWRSSKKDCEDKGATLVIMNTRIEQDFISGFYDRVWIGLSDTDREGKWKWVNGEELVGDGFWQEGEPNNADYGEDCAEVSRSGRGWNDIECRTTLSWICEI